LTTRRLSCTRKPRQRGRPPLGLELRMDTDLRIPLPVDQKAVIYEGTAEEPEGEAAWARHPARSRAAEARRPDERRR
jgi:hypothetical protein